MTAQFILLSLLYLWDVSMSQVCNPELLENEEFFGRELKSVFSPDVNHCQQLCTQHPSCSFFTFIQPDSMNVDRHFHCYLKSGSRTQSTLTGVTSGFSLKNCHLDPQPCLSRVYHGVDFFGGDYKTLFTSDYEGCQRVCTNDPHCQFFTFFNGSFESVNYRYKCHLKFSWTVPRSPWIKTVADLVSGFSLKIINLQPDTKCQMKFFKNSEILGNHTENLLAASPDHCQALCTAHPLCTYFVYTSDDFMCYLKNNPDEIVLKARDGFTSGIPGRTCQPDNNWTKTTITGVDFWGSDLSNLMADGAEACQRACTEDPLCQFFTYVTDRFAWRTIRRMCYLKRIITLPAPKKVSKLANAVSGFSLRKCVSGTAFTPTELDETLSESEVVLL